MEIYTDYRMGMSEYISWEQYPPPPLQTFIHKDVPASTECWNVGCDITVKRQKTGPDYESDFEWITSLKCW